MVSKVDASLLLSDWDLCTSGDHQMILVQHPFMWRDRSPYFANRFARLDYYLTNVVRLRGYMLRLFFNFPLHFQVFWPKIFMGIRHGQFEDFSV